MQPIKCLLRRCIHIFQVPKLMLNNCPHKRSFSIKFAVLLSDMKMLTYNDINMLIYMSEHANFVLSQTTIILFLLRNVNYMQITQYAK